jgi:hypothetical protein
MVLQTASLTLAFGDLLPSAFMRLFMDPVLFVISEKVTFINNPPYPQEGHDTILHLL